MQTAATSHQYPNPDLPDIGDFEEVVQVPSVIRDHAFVEEVEIAKVRTDQDYARPLSQTRVKRLRENFDPNALGVIYLSLRDDILWALDGQHRIAIAKEKGMTRMWARIYIDLTPEKEADLYTLFANTLKQTAMDRFRSKFKAGNPAVVDVVKILQAHGLKMAMYSQEGGNIKSAEVLLRLYDEQGPVFFDHIVGILQEAWGKHRDAWTNYALDGIGQFWLRYQKVVERERLIDTMQGTTPTKVLAKARGTFGDDAIKDVGLAGRWGMVIQAAYNKGLVKKGPRYLPEWRSRFISDEGRARISEHNSAPKEPTEKVN